MVTGIRRIADEVGLLFTILVTKNKSASHILSSTPYLETYVILCSVGLVVCFSWVWCDLKGRVILCEFESPSHRSKVTAGALPFIPHLSLELQNSVFYAIELSSATLGQS